MSSGSTTWTYTYDANGMRTSRTNGTTTYNYIYNGSQLVQMTVGNDTLYFTYDASGVPTTVTLNGVVYYYVVNMQGDVVAIYTADGTSVCYYNYNAWGKTVTATTNNNYTIDELNPLRYRGYVFDSETNLYYLQSRYYNPEWGRFINADGYTSTGQGQLGNNMFAYCLNNPVNMEDSSGSLPTRKQLDGIICVAEDMYMLLINTTFGFVAQRQSYVTATHEEVIHKTKTIMDFDLMEDIKTIDVTLTAVTPAKENGIFFSCSDYGTDICHESFGIDLWGYAGIKGGVSSDMSLFLEVQACPILHGGISVGIGGIGATVGVNNATHSVDVNGRIGWDTVFFALTVIAEAYNFAFV